MAKTQPEQKVQSAILRWLHQFDYEHGGPLLIHTRSGQSGEPKGAADIWLSCNGYHLEIEVKTESGERSSDQERWERICRQCSIPYLLAREVESVVQFVKPYLFATNNKEMLAYIKSLL